MKRCTIVLWLFMSIYLPAQDFTGTRSQSSFLDAFCVADFNMDGFEDIYGISYRSNERHTYVLVNQGITPITFDEQALDVNTEIVGGCAAGDYDGDGDPDVLIAKGEAQSLYILQNQGDASFMEIPLNISGASSFQFADLENDGDLDIIGFSFATYNINFYVNDGDQNFTETTLTSDSNITSFDTGDVDGDEDIDILISIDQFFGEQIVLFENQGSNTFVEKTIAADNFQDIEEVQFGDINGDGKLDILAINEDDFLAWVNMGALSFNQEDLTPYTGTSSFGFLSLGLADYNGDGRLDAAMGDNSGPITWYKNISYDPYEYTKATVSTVQPAYSIVNSDLDNDGDIDIITSNGDLWWFENNIEQTTVSTLELGEVKLKVFPNPFQEFLILENIVPDCYRLDLIDLSGRIIISEVVTQEKIWLSTVPAGTYYLRLSEQANKLQSTMKIIKVK